jgi:hypothetical protein
MLSQKKCVEDEMKHSEGAQLFAINDARRSASGYNARVGASGWDLRCLMLPLFHYRSTPAISWYICRFFKANSTQVIASSLNPAK